ncbi:MAG: sulfatase [bacterium]|nr:sulfatase [bacterium]
MKRALSLLLTVVAVLLLLTYTGCSNAEDSPAETIFLITLDTVRADYFDYTPGNTLTPHFAQLAAEGAYFENAYALTPITLPSHASMFYALPPHQLKIYNNGQIAKVTTPSVVQLLKSKGYDTGAVISLGVLKKDFGLHKGFDEYIENFNGYSWAKTGEEVNRDAFALIKKLKKKGSKAFFWIHYSDPHEPYFPPSKEGNLRLEMAGQKIYSCPAAEFASVKVKLELPPGTHTLVLDTQLPPVLKKFPTAKMSYIRYQGFSIETHGGSIEYRLPEDWSEKKDTTGLNYYCDSTRSEITIVNKGTTPLTSLLSFNHNLTFDDATRTLFYKEEIRYLDDCFGKLVSFLKEREIYDNASFIVMGDHGEGLGEYGGHFGHIHYLNKLYNHVPLLISSPGLTPGKRPEAASNLNIAPTLLDMAKIRKPPFMPGVSLRKTFTPKRILLETYSPEAYFDAYSLIEFPWQVIFYPGRKTGKLEFFDLKNDALGIVNLNDEANRDLLKKARTGSAGTASDAEKIKTQLIHSLLKISRIITATKGKIGKSSKRHQEILKSLGYL